jgi:hypothetical protein
MAETTRAAVSLSRPLAFETPRHLRKPQDIPNALSETVNLKTFLAWELGPPNKLAVDRACRRSPCSSPALPMDIA